MLYQSQVPNKQTLRNKREKNGIIQLIYILVKLINKQGGIFLLLHEQDS